MYDGENVVGTCARVWSRGGHALSNVELTVDDGVDVASGRIRHAGGWVVG